MPTAYFPVPYSSLADIIIPFTLTLPFWITFYAGIKQKKDYIHSKLWKKQNPRIPEEFDFIIVGGGSAGCVLANRLSVSHSVLLLELGGDPNPLARLGPSFYYLQRVPSADLLYETQPQEHAAFANHKQKVFWPRGTGLGGSSNINAMIYQRGNPYDYDNWANITGDSRWNYQSVLPYFKKLENYNGPFFNENFHGKGGPMHIETMRQVYMENYFLQAAKEKGYPVKDLTGINTSGFNVQVVTMKDGLRWGTYQGYIKPILNRLNLRIYRYSRVIKVNLDEHGHAYGVTYLRHGERRFVLARKEIILSAGTIDTPKLLMLSGIGPKAHLESVGVKTLLDLPVGQNLQDHMTVIVGPFLVDTPESLLFKRAASIRTITEFLMSRRGALVTTALSALGYVVTSVRNYDHNWPNIQFTLLSTGLAAGLSDELQNIYNIKAKTFRNYLYGNNYKEKDVEKDANFVGVALQRPKSVGYIKLASQNPEADPIIQPNYLSHPDDVTALVEGMRILVDVMENTTSYRSIHARLVRPFPGCEFVPFKSDAYYECYIRHISLTNYHPVGTAAMGGGLEDKRAVVDPELRVLKTTGLRVVDASIMPQIINGNTNIPTIMIAEVASDMILKQWEWRNWS